MAVESPVFEFSKVQSRIVNLLLISGLLVIFVTLMPSYKSDGKARYRLLEALLNGQPLTEKYSLFLPVLSIVWYLALKLVHLSTQTFTPFFNFLFTIPVGWFTMRLVAQRYGKTVAQFAALLLLATSMFSHHLQWFFGEVTAAFVIVIAYFIKDKYRWVSAILMGLAIWSTPALLPVIAITAAVEVIVTRFKNFRLAVATVIGLLFVLGDNFVKYGTFSSPYLSSQEHGGFGIPSVFVILAVLVSFGKGILWFMPGLWLLLKKNVRDALAPTREAKWVEGAFVVSLVLVYSAWWAWYGGWYWGPRFFLVLCFPAAIAMAIAMTQLRASRNLQKLAVLVLLALSLWVGVEGYLFGQELLADTCQANDYANESLCWYTFDYSALWNPFFGDGFISKFQQLRYPFRVAASLWQIAAVAVVTAWALSAKKSKSA